LESEPANEAIYWGELFPSVHLFFFVLPIQGNGAIKGTPAMAAERGASPLMGFFFQ